MRELKIPLNEIMEQEYPPQYVREKLKAAGFNLLKPFSRRADPTGQFIVYQQLEINP